MSVVWKINDTEIASLGFERVTLEYVNQQPDRLSFFSPATEFDGDLDFELGDEVVLTRAEGATTVTWFRGIIRETPRTRSSRDNSVGYVALGPWQWLERIAYLQTFKTASDADDPASALMDAQRGITVLGQGDDGLKVALNTFLGYVISAASAAGADLAAGTIGVAGTFPWDEVIDLSCAEVISRMLQFLPDAVVWFDYTVDPPALNITRRGDASAVDLAVQPAGAADSTSYVPFESIDLRPRPDLVRSGVALIYVATNRANEASWETYTNDTYPGTDLAGPDILTRTIRLAGSVSDQTILTQKIEADEIPSDLVYDSTTWLTTGSQFDTLRTWWRNHAESLPSSSITILGFAECARATASGDAVNEDLLNELVGGSITEWMETKQGILKEEQIVTAYIAYEITSPADATKKARQIHRFSARILATNAQQKTYSFATDSSFTPAEDVPEGLAEAIYDAVSVLPWDGRLDIVEEECTGLARAGQVINLTGSLTAWSTMKALVQRSSYDLDNGRTSLTVGPPRQLGPDDLVEIYRVNRYRERVTSYMTRTTGKTGTTATAQGLGYSGPRATRGAAVIEPPAVYEGSISAAGVVPTPTEISSAIAAVYTGDAIPTDGDQINLSSGGSIKLRAVVSSAEITPDDHGTYGFTFSGVSYIALVHQVGLF